MKKQFRGTIYLLLATILWGSTFVAQSVGMDYIGPFTFQASRCFLGSVALLPIIAVSDHFKKDGKNFFSRWSDPKLWKACLFCGIPMFIATSLQQMGIVDTDAGKSAFLTTMYIVFVPILGIFLKRKPSKWIPVSVVLSVIGLYCLSCVGVTRIGKGDLLLIGCAFVFAVQIICVGIFAPQVDCLRLNCLDALLCAVLSAVFMGFAETPTWQAIRDCWLSIAYAGVLSMAVGYSLQNVGQKYLESSAASLLMSLESVFAVLSGALILHERMSVWETVGCILVFAAVILSQLPDKKRAHAE